MMSVIIHKKGSDIYFRLCTLQLQSRSYPQLYLKFHFMNYWFIS